MRNKTAHIPFGDKSPAKKADVRPNSIVYSELYKFEATLYAGHYGIKLPLRGAETYILNGQAYQVADEQFLLTNPGQSTDVIVDSKLPVAGICIGITRNFLLELYDDMQSDMDAVLQQKKASSTTFEVINHCFSIHQRSQLASFLRRIKRQFISQGFVGYLEEEQFYYDLGESIINDHDRIQSAINQLPQSRLAVREEVFKRVDIMHQYIHDNFQDNISLEELARAACLSKYHAIRSYQRIHGTSPYQQIKKLRIEKAKGMILQGISISETAHLCGFADYRGFSKQFKQVVGVTPSVYRHANSQ